MLWFRGFELLRGYMPNPLALASAVCVDFCPAILRGSLLRRGVL